MSSHFVDCTTVVTLASDRQSRIEAFVEAYAKHPDKQPFIVLRDEIPEGTPKRLVQLRGDARLIFIAKQTSDPYQYEGVGARAEEARVLLYIDNVWPEKEHAAEMCEFEVMQGREVHRTIAEFVDDCVQHGFWV